MTVPTHTKTTSSEYMLLLQPHRQWRHDAFAAG